MAVVGETSRDRLVTAARRLFAERSLNGVSLREIIRGAGIKHATAIQYHFGDREGLLTAVMTPYKGRVDTRRDAMLDDFEAQAIEDCRAIAAILVRPLARELEDNDGRYFLRIYAQLIHSAPGMFQDKQSSIWRWRRAAEPYLPPGAAAFHPRYSALMFASLELARRASEGKSGDRLFISRVIDEVSAILQAPLSAETDRMRAKYRIPDEHKSADQIA